MYKVVNKKGRIAFNGEKFKLKKYAAQAIVDTIRGANYKDALKYYLNYSIRKV